MSMSKRLKGQETFVNIVANGDLQTRINSIKECEVTFYLEIKEDDFLGETAPRFDMVFKGCGVKIGHQVNDPQIFTLQQTIIARARRQLGPGTRFDMGVAFQFDSGLTGRFIFVDLSFADMNLNTGARDDFTEGTLDAKCSEFVYLG
jgi:hypothetical protein